jgi:hypothetical protein
VLHGFIENRPNRSLLDDRNSRRNLKKGTVKVVSMNVVYRGHYHRALKEAVIATFAGKYGDWR